MNLNHSLSALVVAGVGVILARSAIRHCVRGAIESSPAPGRASSAPLEVRKADNPSIFWGVTILEFAGGLLCLGLAAAIALLPGSY